MNNFLKISSLIENCQKIFLMTEIGQFLARFSGNEKRWSNFWTNDVVMSQGQFLRYVLNTSSKAIEN